MQHRVDPPWGIGSWWCSASFLNYWMLLVWGRKVILASHSPPCSNWEVIPVGVQRITRNSLVTLGADLLFMYSMWLCVRRYFRTLFAWLITCIHILYSSKVLKYYVLWYEYYMYCIFAFAHILWPYTKRLGSWLGKYINKPEWVRTYIHQHESDAYTYAHCRYQSDFVSDTIARRLSHSFRNCFKRSKT